MKSTQMIHEKRTKAKNKTFKGINMIHSLCLSTTLDYCKPFATCLKADALNPILDAKLSPQKNNYRNPQK